LFSFQILSVCSYNNNPFVQTLYGNITVAQFLNDPDAAFIFKAAIAAAFALVDARDVMIVSVIATNETVNRSPSTSNSSHLTSLRSGLAHHLLQQSFFNEMVYMVYGIEIEYSVKLSALAMSNLTIPVLLQSDNTFGNDTVAIDSGTDILILHMIF
jgi:hypothetical protein